MYLRMLAALLLAICMMGCGKTERSVAPAYVGIWTAVHGTSPISIEFRDDGRVIWIHGDSSDVETAGYLLMQDSSPVTMKIIPAQHAGYLVATITHVDAQALHMTLEEYRDNDESKRREAELFVWQRSSEHILPSKTATPQQRDELIRQAMEGHIWFHGPKGQEMLDICEALFRHQIKQYESSGQNALQAYHLEIGRRDPDPLLMQRFADHQPPIQPVSQRWSTRSRIFKIRKIIWMDDNTVEAQGGYHQGPMSGSTNTYRLIRKNKQWEVVMDRTDVIS